MGGFCQTVIKNPSKLGQQSTSTAIISVLSATKSLKVYSTNHVHKCCEHIKKHSVASVVVVAEGLATRVTEALCSEAGSSRLAAVESSHIAI